MLSLCYMQTIPFYVFRFFYRNFFILYLGIFCKIFKIKFSRMVRNVDQAEKVVKKARKLTNPLFGLDEKIIASNGDAFSLKCMWSSHRSKEISDWIFELFRRNMREFYMASQWGYDEHLKRQELDATTARYLILRDLKSNALAGYVHFRFIVENSLPVIYCYEIQFEEKYQGRRLGAQLLDVMYKIGIKTGMAKVMATVFTFNERSLRFFRASGYEIDEFSPDSAVHNADYVILGRRCEDGVR